MNSPNSQQTNKSFYDRISQAYDLIADGGEHKARERGEEALAVQPGEEVLELGFGTGNSIMRFAAEVGESGQVSGIDVSEGMRDVTSKKVTQAGYSSRVNLTVQDARSLPYDDNQFDAAFASFTLELFALDDIPAVLAEAHRVLQPSGRMGIVCMATVAEGESASPLEKTYIWMHQHFPHIVDCQPIDVVAFVEQAHFNVREKLELEIWTMPVRVVIAAPR